MKNRKNFSAVLLAGVLCLTAMETTAFADSIDDPAEVSENQEMTLPDTFRPIDSAIAPRESYEAPYMGLNFVLPENLIKEMEQEKVFMFSDGRFSEDGSVVQYAILSWNTATEEQQEAEVDLLDDSYTEWLDSLGRIGALGVYQSGFADQLEKLTGCDEHQNLGKSEDGTYEYYLSINTKAGEELTGQVSQIQTSITEMVSLEEDYTADSGQSKSSGTSLGEFTTQDVYGNTYTQDIFKDYDLTLVNIFTTWCSPCVAEIPDLEKLRNELADKGVNVVGVVLDALDDNGEIDQEILEKAQLLAEKTGAAYPFLVPDSTFMNGRLTGIYAVPETFFVDKNGNIAGDTYSGSRSFDDWQKTVEQELSALREEN